MERQFSLARSFTSGQPEGAQGIPKPSSDVAVHHLATSQNTGLSAEFSHHMRTYIHNDDSPCTEDGIMKNNTSTPAMSEPVDSNPVPDAQENLDHGARIPAAPLADTMTHSQIDAAPTPGTGLVNFLDDSSFLTRSGSMWWNQDLTSLTEIFGTGIYPQDDYDYNTGML
jgi:hypothetical protein